MLNMNVPARAHISICYNRKLLNGKALRFQPEHISQSAIIHLKANFHAHLFQPEHISQSAIIFVLRDAIGREFQPEHISQSAIIKALINHTL